MQPVIVKTVHISVDIGCDDNATWVAMVADPAHNYRVAVAMIAERSMNRIVMLTEDCTRTINIESNSCIVGVKRNGRLDHSNRP